MQASSSEHTGLLESDRKQRGHSSRHDSPWCEPSQEKTLSPIERKSPRKEDKAGDESEEGYFIDADGEQFWIEGPKPKALADAESGPSKTESPTEEPEEKRKTLTGGTYL